MMEYDYSITVDCPFCGRKAGQRCMNADSSEKPNTFHQARVASAEKYERLRAAQTRKPDNV